MRSKRKERNGRRDNEKESRVSRCWDLVLSVPIVLGAVDFSL